MSLSKAFGVSSICEIHFDSNQGLVGEKIYFSAPSVCVCEGVAVMKLSALGLVVATATTMATGVGIILIPRASLRRSQGALPAGRCSW